MLAFPAELLDPRMALYWVSVPLQAALALVTLVLAPGDARHRAFAVLVACNAAWDLAEGLSSVTDGAHSGAYARAADHFSVWTAFALAAFIALYPTKHRFARGIVPLLAVAAPLASALMFLDHGLFARPGAVGPLRLALLGWFPLLAAGAVMILLDARRGGPERAFPRAIVAGALLVYPLGTLHFFLDAATWTGFVPALPAQLADAARWPQAVVSIASIPAVLLSPFLAAWSVREAARLSTRGAVALGIALGALAVADLVPALAVLGPGATSLTFAALAAYALARGKLFDIDLRLKWTLSRGTIVGTFIAVAFVVSEVVAQQLVSERLGAVAGLVAAGALVFLFAPLKRAAERLANVAMPHVKPSEDYLHTRKREVYTAALEGALADGVITMRERRVLSRLGKELGLDEAEMESIEAGLVAARA